MVEEFGNATVDVVADGGDLGGLLPLGVGNVPVESVRAGDGWHRVGAAEGDDDVAGVDDRVNERLGIGT